MNVDRTTTEGEIVKAHFDTKGFILSHGRAPRGRGCWIFQAQDRSVTVEEEGKYAAARSRAARQHPDVQTWELLP
jgi:hypothetical protein